MVPNIDVPPTNHERDEEMAVCNDGESSEPAYSDIAAASQADYTVPIVHPYAVPPHSWQHHKVYVSYFERGNEKPSDEDDR